MGEEEKEKIELDEEAKETFLKELAEEKYIKQELKHIQEDISGVNKEILSDKEKHAEKINNLKKEINDILERIEHQKSMKEIANQHIADYKRDIADYKRDLKFFEIMVKFISEQIEKDFDKWNYLSDKLSEDIEFKPGF